MAEEAGSELVSVIFENLVKVKNALNSKSNMDKTLKEEARKAVSEIDGMLNKISSMFMGLEQALKKALAATERSPPRTYSEQLAASIGR